MDSDEVIELAGKAGFVVDELSRKHQPNCIFHTWYPRNEYTLDDDGACGFSRVRDWTRFEDIHNQSKEQEMKLQFTPPPGAIHFHTNSNGAEVMRISRDGIWANPDIPADDAAKLVLGALDRYIKELVKRAVEDEREACAQIVDHILKEGGSTYGDAIRARSRDGN